MYDIKLTKFYLDPEYCRTALSSHVYYFQPVSTKNWAQNINTIIHSKLENGSLPQLSNVTRIGQQSTQVWVFGSQVQFQPNGSPIPMDMITQHFSTINAIGSPVKQGKGKVVGTMWGFKRILRRFHVCLDCSCKVWFYILIFYFFNIKVKISEVFEILKILGFLPLKNINLKLKLILLMIVFV